MAIWVHIEVNNVEGGCPMVGLSGANGGEKAISLHSFHSVPDCCNESQESCQDCMAYGHLSTLWARRLETAMLKQSAPSDYIRCSS